MTKTKTKQPKYKLADLIQGLEVSIQGDPDCIITGVSPLHQAQPGHIAFLTNSLYRKYLATTQASAVILSDVDATACPVNAVVSSNPYYIYAKIAAFFSDERTSLHGVHPTAIVGEGSQIAASAQIAAYCVLGRNAKIANNVIIHAGCKIGDEVQIGEDSVLCMNVVIHDHVSIGKRSRIASNAVIGGDGFGFANEHGRWHKVPQLGTVEIGDDVDIGANTTIDRGAVDNTVIEDGVKLDNQVQVAHNVRIGANTIIAGCVAIAGSTVIGKNCMVGGASCFAGHITVCDNTMITGMTAVTKSIRESGIYSSGIVGAVPNKEFRKNNARFHRLENLMQRVKTLESTIKDLTERK